MPQNRNKRRAGSGIIYRDAQIEGIQDAEERMVSISFSSEEPIRDWYNSYNILGHESREVDLKRINNNGPVLMGHNSSVHVGAVKRAWLDKKDKKCRAEIKIGRTQEANDTWTLIEDGILSGISVGAEVLSRELVSDKDGVKTYRSTKWMPYEISLTPIPADLSVGVGRSLMDEDNEQMNEEDATPTVARTTEPAGTPAATTTSAPTNAAPAASVTSEPVNRGLTDHEIREISRIGREYGFADAALEAIGRQERPGAFAERCLKLIQKRNQGAQAGANHDSALNLNRSEIRKFSIANLARALSYPRNNRYQEEAKFELECSRALGDEEGNAITIPSEVMRSWGVYRADPIAGTPGSNMDAFVEDDLMINQFVELLRSKSSVLQKVSVLTGLTGRYAFPVGTKNSEVGWTSVDGALPETDVDNDKNDIQPRKVGGIFNIKESALIFASVATEQFLRKNITEAMAEAMSRIIFYGSGTGDVPAGLSVNPGINLVPFAAENPTYKELVDLHMAIKANEITGSNTQFFMNTLMEGHFLTTPRENGLQAPILSESGSKLLGREYEATGLVKRGHIFYGDFSEILLGVWDSFKIELNPYGKNWNANEIKMKAYQIAGVTVRRPEAFSLGSM